MFPFPFSFLGSSLSAAFSYSASAYCQNAATDPTPTVTGTSGGTFTAAEKFFPFQMQFDTSGGKTITIPNTVGSSFTVDWGDTTVTTETGGTISHTYATGIATSIVSIGATGDSGAFTYFAFANSGSKSDLIDVPQWGSIVWSNMLSIFNGCNNSNFTTITATDTPDLSNVTSFLSAFRTTTYLQSINNINNWDVSNVENMGYMFNSSAFNSDISSWDVSSVISLGSTFYYATSFNQDISSWDVSSVTNIAGIFRNATSFNQNLSSWAINTGSFTASLAFRDSGMSTANYTDTIVGWAVTVYKNSAPYTVNMGNQLNMEFDRARTSDSASGQTYANKYGSDWPSNPAGENWTNAGDARDYLTDSIANGGANWTISGDP